MDFLNKISKKDYIKSFLGLILIYSISISALIRANYYYIDDLSRASSGMKGWDHFSRYISVWLSQIIHADSYLTDISPLPQLIAIVFLALAATILLHMLKQEKITFWMIIAAVPLALTPYYLECLSYKFDAPYIALSVLVSIAPVLIWGDTTKSRIIYAISVVAGALIMCMTYQASSGIFPMLVAAVAFKRWNAGEKTKQVLILIAISAAAYVVGVGIFKYFILKPVFSYVTTYQAPVSSLPAVTFSNLKTYFTVIFRDFKPAWLILSGAIALDFIIASTLNSNKNKVLAFVISLLTAAVMLLMSFGAYALLEKSFYNPRAMYGIGVCIAMLGISATAQKHSWISRISAVALAWMFIVFAFTYGNCLNVQAKYTDFRVNQIIADLNDLEEFNNDNMKTVKFSGSIGLSPIINNISRSDYTMLDSLIPTPFGDQTDLSTTGFYYYYNIPNIVRYDLFTQLDADKLPVLKDTMYHTIRGDGTQFLIELK